MEDSRTSRRRFPRPSRQSSCIRCSERKKKCDGKRPCSRCIGHGDVCRPVDEHYLRSRYERKNRLRAGLPLDEPEPPSAESRREALALGPPTTTSYTLVRALDDLTLAKILRVFWNDPSINVGCGSLEAYFALNQRKVHSLPSNDLALVVMITAVTLQSLSFISPDETLPIDADHEQFYNLAVQLAMSAEAGTSVDLSTIYALALRSVYMKYQTPRRQRRARFANKEAQWALMHAVSQAHSIGLYQDLSAATDPAYASAATHLFWTLYYLDRSYSMTFGTPCLLQNELITCAAPRLADGYGIQFDDVLAARVMVARDVSSVLNVISRQPRIPLWSLDKHQQELGMILRSLDDLRSTKASLSSSKDSMDLLDIEGFRIMHLKAEVYGVGISLYRPHLRDILCGPVGGIFRQRLLRLVVAALQLHQQLRMEIPQHTVANIPIFECTSTALLLLGTGEVSEVFGTCLSFFAFVIATCRDAYQGNPISLQYVEVLHQMMRQVGVQVQNPDKLEQYRPLWMKHLVNAPLEEMVEVQHLASWEKLIAGFE